MPTLSSVDPASPPVPKSSLNRRKSVRKKTKKSIFDSGSPIKRQLKETSTWTKDEMHIFPNLPTAKERVEFIYSVLPPDATGLDRLWPIEIVQKDSRIRRQLSERGKDYFLSGDLSKVLDYYNEACLFSSAKGLGHTLARRAAYLMQTEEVDLALRDIRLAFDLGCLERELLDFLLAHHATDAAAASRHSDESVDRTVGVMTDPDVDPGDKRRFMERLRRDLREIKVEKKGRPTEEDVENVMRELREIVSRKAKEEESRRPSVVRPEIPAPTLSTSHPRYPSFTSSIEVVYDSDKGRMVVATEEIKLGDLIMVEKPNTLFFCPEADKISLLKTHCLHCMRFSKAPLPCEDCCVVSFCSVQCKDLAKSTYHKYECKMKLYEMLHFMGDEYIDVFMAIRTITQRDIDYFLDRQFEIEQILKLEFPELIVDTEPWESDSIESLLRLMGHQKDMDEQKLLDNAVIAVFFLRALQAANFFEGSLKRKHPGDRRLQEPEVLILNILNHLINIQTCNAEPFTRLTSATATDDNVYFQVEIGRKFFDWEKIGSCVSSSLALVNHSCDANCTRFFMGDQIVLAATRHIQKGEEITISYDGIHHETQPLMPRQLQLLRKFYFSCECEACEGDWCQYDEMADDLHKVPNFEHERHFKERMGDKKDLVSEIDFLKLAAEKQFRENKIEEAIESLDRLSFLLETQINKPHQYHIQANQAARLCVKMRYLQEAIADIKDVDFKTRGVPPKFVDGELVTQEELDRQAAAAAASKALKRRKSVRKKAMLASVGSSLETAATESGEATPKRAAKEEGEGLNNVESKQAEGDKILDVATENGKDIEIQTNGESHMELVAKEDVKDGGNCVEAKEDQEDGGKSVEMEAVKENGREVEMNGGDHVDLRMAKEDEDSGVKTMKKEAETNGVDHMELEKQGGLELVRTKADDAVAANTEEKESQKVGDKETDVGAMEIAEGTHKGTANSEGSAKEELAKARLTTKDAKRDQNEKQTAEQSKNVGTNRMEVDDMKDELSTEETENGIAEDVGNDLAKEAITGKINLPENAETPPKAQVALCDTGANKELLVQAIPEDHMDVEAKDEITNVSEQVMEMATSVPNARETKPDNVPATVEEDINTIPEEDVEDEEEEEIIIELIEMDVEITDCQLNKKEIEHITPEIPVGIEGVVHKVVEESSSIEVAETIAAGEAEKGDASEAVRVDEDTVSIDLKDKGSPSSKDEIVNDSTTIAKVSKSGEPSEKSSVKHQEQKKKTAEAADGTSKIKSGPSENATLKQAGNLEAGTEKAADKPAAKSSTIEQKQNAETKGNSDQKGVESNVHKTSNVTKVTESPGHAEKEVKSSSIETTSKEESDELQTVRKLSVSPPGKTLRWETRTNEVRRDSPPKTDSDIKRKIIVSEVELTEKKPPETEKNVLREGETEDSIAKDIPGRDTKENNDTVVARIERVNDTVDLARNAESDDGGVIVKDDAEKKEEEGLKKGEERKEVHETIVQVDKDRSSVTAERIAETAAEKQRDDGAIGNGSEEDQKVVNHDGAADKAKTNGQDRGLDVVSASEIEAVAKLEVDTELEAVAKLETDLKHNAEAETNLKAETKVKAVTKPKTETTIEADSKLKADAKLEPVTKPRADAKITEAELKLKADTEVKAVTKSKADTKNKANSKLEPVTKPKADTNIEFDAKLETVRKSKADKKIIEAHSELKPDTKVEAVAMLETDTKPESDMERSEGKEDERVTKEVTSDAIAEKVDAKSDKAEESREIDKDAMTASLSESQTGMKGSKDEGKEAAVSDKKEDNEVTRKKMVIPPPPKSERIPPPPKLEKIPLPPAVDQDLLKQCVDLVAKKEEPKQRTRAARWL